MVDRDVLESLAVKADGDLRAAGAFGNLPAGEALDEHQAAKRAHKASLRAAAK